MNKFTSVNAKTINYDVSSVFEIEISYFENWELVKEFQFFVNPEEEYLDDYWLDFYSKTAEDIISSPKFPDIYNEIKTLLEGTLVIYPGSFVINSFRSVFNKYDLPIPECEFINSELIARRAWDEVSKSGYGLVALKEMFNLEDNEATSTGRIVCLAAKKLGMSLNELLTFIKKPKKRDRTHNSNLKYSPGNPDGFLFGELIVITGKLNYNKAEYQERINKAGGAFADKLNKKTTILVVGELNNIKSNKSAKISTAEKYNREDGLGIKIISAADFYELMESEEKYRISDEV